MGVPLENPAVGDAGVGAGAGGVEGQALWAESSGDVDGLGVVEEEVVGVGEGERGRREKMRGVECYQDG